MFSTTNMIRTSNMIRPLMTSRQISIKAKLPTLTNLKPDWTKFKLKSQPLGYIIGTVNDAYIPPTPSFKEGSYHWAFEKMTTVLMVPLLITPFVTGVPLPIFDSIFNTLLLLHCKAGFESCIIDYIPERVYGVWHKYAMWLLSLGTWCALYGVFLLETKENGLFEFIMNLYNA